MSTNSKKEKDFELFDEAKKLNYEAQSLSEERDKLVLKSNFTKKDFAVVLAIAERVHEIKLRMKEIYEQIN